MIKKLIFLLIIILNFIVSITKSTTLPNQFNIIGPFSIGEREENFDSLEQYGGIFSIAVGDNTKYPSELGTNGVVGWKQLNSTIAGQLEIDWSDSVNWSFYDIPFGFEIYLWYAYAVGDFQATSSSNYIINCNSIRSYYIQTLSNIPGSQNQVKEFTGDFYNYNNGQNIINLEAGQNYRLFVRMISSTRENLSPLGKFSCQLSPVPSYQVITFIETESLVPDIVGTNLASEYASITILNSANQDLTGVSLNLTSTSLASFNITGIFNNNTQGNTFSIIAGQRLSISFGISSNIQLDCPLYLELNVIGNETLILSNINIPFNCSTFSNPFKFTFLDFDNTVQYAMVSSPIEQCGNSSELCNIMVATHDAGVTVSDYSWVSSLPRLNNLWVLSPTGRTSWGYDWSSTSRLNVLNAIKSLALQLPGVPLSQKSLYKTDETKIIFIGNSMGGYGCWNLLVRQGDLALGGMCAGGYSKLSLYLSYETSSGFGYIDQTLKSILMSSIEENNVDLISSNLVGLPLMTRYGSNDTIISPWHSRRLARMVCDQSMNETSVIISEESNASNWFDGILNDAYVTNFYNQLASNNQFLPPIPKTITISTLNPASTGPRANIYILQQKIPFRIAKIKLTQVYEDSRLVWLLETSNVRRFAIMSTPARSVLPVELVIDGASFNNDFFYPEYHFENTKDNTNKKSWVLSNANDTSWEQNEKNILTSGPIRQIFEKNFKIIYGSMGSSTAQLKQAAIYISNFWNTYSRGSAPIFSDVDYIPIYSDEQCDENQNYILLGSSNQNVFTDKLIQKSAVQFNVDNSFTLGQEYEFNIPGSGIAFIIPNQCGKGLILIIAGYDNIGFDNALHAIPKRSNEITAPDFIIVGPEFKSKGYGGILSAGFWSYNFTLSQSSFYTSLI